MLKERARIIATGLLGVDLLLVGAAFFLGFWIRSDLLPQIGLLPRLYPLREYLPLLPLALAIWGVLLIRFKLYYSHRTVSLLDEAWDIIRVCLTAAVILALVIYSFRLDDLLLEQDKISRLWILLVVALATLLLLSRIVVVRLTAGYVRLRGYNYRTILIVGTNGTAQRVADSIDRHRYWGYKILGHISEQENQRQQIGSYPVLGAIADIPDIVENQVVDEVIFALDRRKLDLLEDLLLSLEEQGVRTRITLNLFPHAKAKVEVGTLDGMPVMTYSTTPTNELLLLWKRLMDVVVSAILLTLALPAMLLVALLIKLGSGGSVLFRQTRCGLSGRLFTLYKFRTMVENAEERRQELVHLNEMGGPAFKLRKDPRVTPVGRFLRKFSLDELPQLWNVLKGDMSLVGPRPPVPNEVSEYERWQRRRLSMRPGLTCLWQVSGRNEIDFNRWMELDLEYIDSWSPLLDLKILAKTIPVVLTGRGAS